MEQDFSELERASSNEAEEIQTNPTTEFWAEQNLLINDRLKEELAHLKQDRNLRKGYANKVFYLTCIWLGLIFLIVLLQGFKEFQFGILFSMTPGIIKFEFALEETVMVALLTTTTINIIGFFYTVTRHIFPNRDNGPDNETLK